MLIKPRTATARVQAFTKGIDRTESGSYQYSINAQSQRSEPLAAQSREDMTDCRQTADRLQTGHRDPVRVTGQLNSEGGCGVSSAVEASVFTGLP